MVRVKALTPTGPRRAVAVLALIILGIGGGDLFYTSAQTDALRAVAVAQQMQARELAGQVAKLQTAVRSMCGASADIGTAPVLVPGGAAPSKLAIQLVADERGQWRKLGCPGRLPYQPGFTHWAAVYHIPPK